MLDLTPKQEAFAQAYHETGNASEAYRRAYNAGNMKEETIWRKAKEVVDNGKVTARLSELQERAQKRHDITIDRLTEMTLAAFNEAQRISPTSGQMQTASMIKAAEFLGKLHGLVVDKSEISGKDGAPIIPVLNVTVGRNQSEPAS
jgi:phage terminase small subunit